MRNLLYAAIGCAVACCLSPIAKAQQPVSAEEAREIARETFIYAYPLVLSHVTFLVGTNVEEPTS